MSLPWHQHPTGQSEVKHEEVEAPSHGRRDSQSPERESERERETEREQDRRDMSRWHDTLDCTCSRMEAVAP